MSAQLDEEKILQLPGIIHPTYIFTHQEQLQTMIEVTVFLGNVQSQVPQLMREVHCQMIVGEPDWFFWSFGNHVTAFEWASGTSLGRNL